MIEVKFNCANTSELMSEMNALLVGMKVANKEIDNAPPRLEAATAAKPEGIAAQEVKRGPGRPPSKDKAAAAKPAAVATPTPATPAAAPAPEVETADVVETSFEDYKTFMSGVFTSGHRGIVMEVIGEYGAQKISQVPADKYDEVMAKVGKRVEAAALA